MGIFIWIFCRNGTPSPLIEMIRLGKRDCEEVRGGSLYLSDSDEFSVTEPRIYYNFFSHAVSFHFFTPKTSKPATYDTKWGALKPLSLSFGLTVPINWLETEHKTADVSDRAFAWTRPHADPLISKSLAFCGPYSQLYWAWPVHQKQITVPCCHPLIFNPLRIPVISFNLYLLSEDNIIRV